MEQTMAKILAVMAALCVVCKIAAVRQHQRWLLSVASNLRRSHEAQRELKKVLTEEHRVASQQQRLTEERARLLATLWQLKTRGDESARDVGAALGALIIADLLPSKIRTSWLAAIVVLEVGAIINNLEPGYNFNISYVHHFRW